MANRELQQNNGEKETKELYSNFNDILNDVAGFLW
jgi:hypothetical protein